jgi:putative ABC transport system substrate-binding protein
LKVQLQHLNLLDPKDFEPAFGTARKARADAVLALGSAIAASHKKEIIDLAAKNRLPAMYPHAGFIQEGGLMTYAVSFTDLNRRAATFVDKILKGRKPAELPVEQPMKFEFIVNLKAAKQIGLTIPPNVLVRANKVIR